LEILEKNIKIRSGDEGYINSITEIENQTTLPTILGSFLACPPGSSRILPRNRKSLQRGGGWDALLGENNKGLSENSGPFLFVNNFVNQSLQQKKQMVNFN
jgi:hypothetical protein